MFGSPLHRLNPQKSSSVLVLFHTSLESTSFWKSLRFVEMNSFNTLLLIYLDRGESDARFEKKVVQSDEV